MLLLVKQFAPFIKYIINVFEMATLSNFEFKSTFFTIVDFISTSICILIQIIMCVYVIRHHGLPFYIL